MIRARLMVMGVAGVVAVGALSGCGSGPAAVETTESTADVPAVVTQDVALAVEGMT